jgi:hypothetical protein
MIETLILPVGFACAAEYAVGVPGGPAFPLIRYARQVCLGRQEDMNVIGHHGEGVQ